MSRMDIQVAHVPLLDITIYVHTRDVCCDAFVQSLEQDLHMTRISFHLLSVKDISLDVA